MCPPEEGRCEPPLLQVCSGVPLEPAANVSRCCLQHLAVKGFEYNLNLSRKKFKDALAEDSGQRGSYLYLLPTELHSRQMMHELKSLEKQGQMMRTDTPDGASLC